ncbi:MAG: hypothetical protein KKE20_01910 [Nanoarchaeota archaeon]|nr:hypothetical protein [Nanoarchaeota archaeon]
MQKDKPEYNGHQPLSEICRSSMSDLTDKEISGCVMDAWSLYEQGNNPGTRSSLYTIIEEANTRELCRPVIEDVLRKLLKDLYTQCCNAGSDGQDSVQVLAKVNTFNRLIYKLETLGYHEILADHTKEIEHIKGIEDDARPGNHKSYGGPEEGH